MDRFFVLFVTATVLFCSCGKKGYKDGKGGFEAQPQDMVYIEAGSFMMGSADEDVVWAMNAGHYQKTVDGFWMDETEVTNNSYRRFVTWTADSVARRILGEAGVDGFLIEEDDDIDPGDQPRLNYKTKIVNNPKSSAYEEQFSALKDGGFYYTRQEAMGEKGQIDIRNLYYDYSWFDLEQAAKAKWDPSEKRYVGTVTDMQGETQEIVDRSSFIMHESIPVYPDTLCWIRDFAYFYNEPFATQYFSNPSYGNYPVVGVSWKQAVAYTHWRTYHLKGKIYRKQYESHRYRLPLEVEFEYAARGGLNMQLYPWGGPYATNKLGCYLANFKPQRGNYALDGGARTMPVATYEPNDWGLYDMAGNVAEWVNDMYDENSYSFLHDLVPTYHYSAKESDKRSMKRKVVRGGSWKDISYFLQCGARSYEYQDSTKSYIGFRCVRDVLGTSKD